MGDEPGRAYAHTNRKGDVYLLQARRSGGKGVPYFFGKKLSGAPVERLPEGYEAYEKPEDAQVFVRKTKPSPILPAERDRVCHSIRALAPSANCIVQIEGKSLVIYLADIEPDLRLGLIRLIAPVSEAEAEGMKRFMLKRTKYEKTMRFALTETKTRLFSAERWCFNGAIDNWIYLKGLQPLAELLEEFVPHLGQESFFELM